ncbi:hypothetical protein JCM3766R1_003215 [Sporobolomyces carnicolor]
MPHSIPRDLISFLPPELLSRIFELACDDPQALCAPINRALLPFQRRALFRHVRISSQSQLDHGPGGAIDNKRRLGTLLSALVNLKRLEIGWNSTTFIGPILSLRFARSNLPQLRSLGIQVAKDCPISFDAKIYRALEEYPSLRRLAITIPMSDDFTAIPSRGMKFTKIEDLALKGCRVDRLETHFCLDSFTNLTSLSLDNSPFADSDYSALAARLPTSLISLTIHTSGNAHASTPRCARFLSHLVNLEYLYLGPDTMTTT